MKLNKFVISAAAGLSCFAANAAEIDMNTARMQAMDKITGHVSVINVPVNGGVKFGSLSIVVRSCKTRPAEEAPENFVFADITDKSLKGEEINIFKGWMLSSSPATNALEHPIYDVWLLQCLNTKVDQSALLDEKQLAERDNLPMSERKILENSVSGELKTEEKAPEKTEENAKKPMSEMEYLPDESEDGKPETIAEPAEAENSEFSFDEDDDTAEIQNEISRIKSDWENKDINAEKQ
ncbi:MAG TPA: hypothetical protein DD619_04875 [Alphaproteobacteria bacterium]|nr:hypothetical protein [Alphaproteobacteria bacterium]